MFFDKLYHDAKTAWFARPGWVLRSAIVGCVGLSSLGKSGILYHVGPHEVFV
ncbi:hypothetical protein DFP92_101699 [Yoonia sediminilitoris]|uniref:Uncharacterized protein n=1 Tax=Yoonia sediminilitoris TaxID=1286148 RepID=A0A2T6KRC9_9RHOB|nr:hypothetical protein C8N45_101699 [Yoonia sediminilitoris]RCW99276.1 hypothetical protein DFP92_101699 [Yoonia sediminilitoris]